MKKITLTETTGGSFKCVLPKNFIESLGWENKDQLEVKKVGDRIIINKHI